jgi:hypothetical protein
LKIKSQKDFWSGLMFVIVGVAFAWGATNYSFGSSARPGPGYFPLGLGVLMALLGSLVLFKALTIETDGGDPIGNFAWRPLLVILGSVVLFGTLLPRTGMIIALPVLVIVSSFASTEFSWRGTIINSVLLTAMSWVMFVWGLKLTIPMWPIWLGR